MSDNLAMYSALVGTLLPALVSKVVTADMEPGEKAAIAVLTSLLAAFGTAYFKGQINADDLVSSFLIVFTAATVTYQTFWKPSGYSAKLNREGRGIRTE